MIRLMMATLDGTIPNRDCLTLALDYLLACKTVYCCLVRDSSPLECFPPASFFLIFFFLTAEWNSVLRHSEKVKPG